MAKCQTPKEAGNVVLQGGVAVADRMFSASEVSEIYRMSKPFVDRLLSGGCLHEALDGMNPEKKGEPRMLHCPCPKCTPR